jgi:hypothetical protein
MASRMFRFLALAAYLFVAQGCSKLLSSDIASQDNAPGKPHDEVAELAGGHFLDLKVAPALQQTRTHSRRRTSTVGE